MARKARRAAAILAILWVVAAPTLAQTPMPEIGRLRAHVATLASAEFGGRSGPGGIKAAEYVRKEFEKLGLEPAFNGSFIQEIPRFDGKGTFGRNVAGRWVGSDPRLRDEWIIVAAHFDHLGVRNGVRFPGADDNASMTAVMLETARAITQGATRPKRSLLFVGFDLEELGLIGSRYFVDHSPIPLDRIKLFITGDLMGRALAGVCKGQVFVLGAERAPGLHAWVDEAAREQNVKLGQLGTDVLGIDRSDYGPFRVRKVPYLFFSTGESPDYHQPTDTSDTLDYTTLEANARIIHRLVRKAVCAEVVPAWGAEPDGPSMEEVAVVRGVFQTLFDHKDELKLRTDQLTLLTNSMATVEEISQRGKITPRDRALMVRAAQRVLFSVR